MVNRLISVGDDFALPAAVKAGDGNLPARLQDATLNSTFASTKQVAPGVKLYNARGLRRWHVAEANARFNVANIVAIGDSISVGVGADGQPNGTPGTAYDDTVRPRGWVGHLRSHFADKYGNTGPGWISAPDNGLRVTLANGALSATYGPREQGFRITGATHTATITTSETFTGIEFWTWDGGSGTFNVTIDGGAPQSFNAGTGNINLRTWTKHTISGLSDATHTVVFGNPSASAFFAGVNAYRQTTGVRVHRMAKSGDTTNNVLGLDSINNANTEAKARSLAAIGLVPAANLVIVALGVNDHGNQASTDTTTQAQPGTTPDQYEANMRAIANQAVAAGAAVLLLGEPRRPAPTGAYTEQDYWDRAKKIAQDTDHVAFLDINDVWGSNTLGNQLGLYTASSVHPTIAGHASMARTVFAALTQPLGFNAPSN